MSGVIESLERAQLRRVPVFQAGDRVRVHFQVVEGTRRRTQVFEGVVIKRQGTGVRETFTLHSPKIEKIDVAARGDVRRAKLYYLRERVGRASRVRERRWMGGEEQAYVEGAMPPDDAPRPGEEELADATAAEVAAAEAAEDGAGEETPAAEQGASADESAPAAEAAPVEEAAAEPEAAPEAEPAAEASDEPAPDDEPAADESASDEPPESASS
jgi:large subunit ribosomal protein L19